jgi:hypothetical protein
VTLAVTMTRTIAATLGALVFIVKMQLITIILVRPLFCKWNDTIICILHQKEISVSNFCFI